jgi:Fusaric acid resistance protein family
MPSPQRTAAKAPTTSKNRRRGTARTNRSFSLKVRRLNIKPAWFPQARALFLVALALWAAACGLVATLLHNFASYAAALAGFTAAIIAADELGATGSPNANEVFILAVYRASEICIGIVSAGIVPAGTRFRWRPAPARRLVILDLVIGYM